MRQDSVVGEVHVKSFRLSHDEINEKLPSYSMIQQD